MIVKVKRFHSNEDATLGLMFIDDEFSCFTLEDEFRAKKVMGETRIPAGEYKIGFRSVGGHHARYGSKFKSMHKGMLELKDVPNFKYILIHIGNTDEDTAGCLLIGDSASSTVSGEGSIGNSTSAYKRVYPVIASALENGESVTINIEDETKKK